ncbi:DUF7504 family protein [Halocatena salina]|uniref:Uncharacterized protein n=1 Tax=Halocatena salina TaxID=2934340 RepID=A0A8U0A106_9EURY|nr:hypothetical protein [Halocatena salina]UPM42754.1 hypothetical protein MW046_12445 [Halocatena salina]
MKHVSNTPNVSEPTRTGESFTATLMRLKRRGCCVLVTGQVDERVRAAQSRRLFGECDESRQRVLTLTDATPGLDAQYLPENITPTHSSVTELDYTDVVRDVAGTVDPAFEHSQPDIGLSGSMTGLGAILYDSVRETIRDDRTKPGELRLGIATLCVLLDTDGLSATETFIRALRTDILAVRGMGHFHLPGAPDSETLAALKSPIDIHIELRESNGIVEHQWHLLETDHLTDWLPLRR